MAFPSHWVYSYVTSVQSPRLYLIYVHKGRIISKLYVGQRWVLIKQMPVKLQMQQYVLYICKHNAPIICNCWLLSRALGVIRRYCNQLWIFCGDNAFRVFDRHPRGRRDIVEDQSKVELLPPMCTKTFIHDIL